VLTLLNLAEKQVRTQLFDAVRARKGWVLVAMARHGPEMREVEDREPFATLERDNGAQLLLIVVLDEGKPEGMWRDPVGDLAEALYPGDKTQAAQAAHGYFLLKDGAPIEVVKKHASLLDDARVIQEVLGQRHPRARASPPKTASPAFAGEGQDPYALLGITKDTPPADARKAFRALMALYHPDKVAHMAKEFRTLAETRTRELTAAWERVQQERERG
jgi:DnaJ-domain-containing protein 1